MKWSRFVHVFPTLDLLWHALKMEKIQATSTIISAYSRSGRISTDMIGQAAFDQLVAAGFIVDENDSEENLLPILAPKCRQIRSLYLIMTTLCNLSCSYCLYNSERSGSLAKSHGRAMSDDIAREAINLFAEQTAKNDRSKDGYGENITFYGGEPMMNFDCLCRTIGYVRDMQLEGKIWSGVKFVINTNGTLLTPTAVEFFKKEGVEVQVSIDGPQTVHDQVRMFHSGQGSYEATLAGLELMHERNCNFVPLITVTDANMESLPKFVGWLCERFGIKEYGLNSLMHTNGPIDLTYGSRAAAAMRATRKIAAYYGVIDEPYVQAVGAYAARKIAPKSCGAGDKIVVFPQGELHVCQALEGSGVTAMGQLPKFDCLAENLLKWQTRNRFDNPVCLDCPAVGGCQGGCGASAFNASGDVCGIDVHLCNRVKAEFAYWLEGGK